MKNLHDVQVKSRHKVKLHLDALECRASVGQLEYTLPPADLEALKISSRDDYNQEPRTKLES